MTDDDGRNLPLGVALRLLDILAEMEQQDQRHRRGHGRLGDNVTFDYCFSIGLGPEQTDATGPERTDTTGPERTDATGLVTTRPLDDGRIVVADLPGIDPEAVDVDVDRRSETLRLWIDGDPVERVPLPDTDAEVVDTTFSNGILEVRLR